jgi:hypothetical protein
MFKFLFGGNNRKRTIPEGMYFSDEKFPFRYTWHLGNNENYQNMYIKHMQKYIRTKQTKIFYPGHPS